MKKILTCTIILLFVTNASVRAEDTLLELARVLSYQKKFSESLERYDQYLAKHPKDLKASFEAAEVSFWSGNYDKAKGLYETASKDKRFAEKSFYQLGEIYLIQGDFKSSEENYSESLKYNPKNALTRTKLADVLSYQNKFDESVSEYDVVLQDSKEDPKTYSDAARKKGRILGWEKKFKSSLASYADAYNVSGNDAIKFESEGKKAFWNKHNYKAISKYRQTLELEPDNAEARFDLGQIEGYQRMYKDSVSDFQYIVDKNPGHFMAKDSLDKVQIIRKEPYISPTVWYYRGNGSSRETHINRLTSQLDIGTPLGDYFDFSAGYAFDYFHFKNASDVKRNRARFGGSFFAAPYLSINANYSPVFYNLDKRKSQLFDGTMTLKPFDPLTVTGFVVRDDLFNNRPVFVLKLRSTDCGGKLQLDVNRFWTSFADYRRMDLNDGNTANTFGFEQLVFLSYEPKRFSIDWRIDYLDYKNPSIDYFAPQNFWTNTLTFHWRHYLNDNGLYYGARNTYYGFKYKFKIDNAKKPFNGGEFEFYHDFTRKVAFQGTVFGNYSSVYQDLGGYLNLIARF